MVWDVADKVPEAPCARTIPAMSKESLNSGRE